MTMNRIVRCLPTVAIGFCLTISTVYAAADETFEQTVSLPTLVIDLATIAITQYQQWAQLTLGLAVVGGLLAILGLGVLSCHMAEKTPNQGDKQARQVLFVWLGVLVVTMMGFALPLQRVL